MNSVNPTTPQSTLSWAERNPTTLKVIKIGALIVGLGIAFTLPFTHFCLPTTITLGTVSALSILLACYLLCRRPAQQTEEGTKLEIQDEQLFFGDQHDPGELAKILLNNQELKALQLNASQTVENRHLLLLPKSLTELTIMACNQLTENIGAFLGKAPNLECLRINRMEIRNRELANLSLTPKLKHLSTYDCASLTDAAFANLHVDTPNLESLDVSRCPKLTPAFFEHVKKLKHLTVINIVNCDGLKVHDVPASWKGKVTVTYKNELP